MCAVGKVGRTNGEPFLLLLFVLVDDFPSRRRFLKSTFLCHLLFAVEGDNLQKIVEGWLKSSANQESKSPVPSSLFTE
jgi:hypothetical protein